MRAPILPVIILCAIAGTAEAAIYKCVIDGETVFSEQPCADDAQEVQIKVTQPDDAARDESAARTRSMADVERTLATDRRRTEVQHEIDTLESRIRILQREMDIELAKLRARKEHAANNLAGATLEQSIATEMQAVTAKYQARIDTAQARLRQLYSERERLSEE